MVSGHHAPAFTVCVVGDNHGGTRFDAADSGDHPSGGRLTFIPVVRDQQANFEEHAPGIDQLVNPLTRGQLAFAVLLFDFPGAAAGPELVFKLVQAGNQRAHVVHGRLSH